MDITYIRSFRLFKIALFDVFLTAIVAAIIAWYVKVDFYIIFFTTWLVAEIIHIITGVSTPITRVVTG